MSLDRDELAARAMAARAALLSLCDALSALVPVAPASGAPLAAPSPSPEPAATPAAYVPSVGDVVKQMTETDAVATTGAIRVVVSTDPLRWVYVENGAKVGGACEPKGWADEVRFVRRATSSERAAAGLPVDETPAFDEASEREAALGVWRTTVGGLPDNFVEGWLARARVAAKGGA